MRKKWMGHDQITVETAFRYPRPESGESRHKSPIKSPPSDTLDAQLRFMEHAQYKEYVEEYNRQAIEHEVEQRRVLRENF